MKVDLIKIFAFFLSINSIIIQYTNAQYFDSISKKNIDHDGICGIDAIDSLNSYKLFLVGETHGRTINNTIKYELIERLHEKCNIRLVIEESGYASCFLINKYLENGSDSFLSEIVFFNEDKNFYRKIHQFNNKISNKDKITFFGVDYERNVLNIGIAISYLLSDTPPEELFWLNDFYECVNLDKSLNIYPRYTKYLYELYKESLCYSKEYKDYFGKNYIHFFLIMNSYLGRINKFSKSSTDILWERENYIYNNIMNIPDTLKEKNMFGQFGHIHILLSDHSNILGIKKWSSFASKLNSNNETPFYGNVYSMWIIEKKRDIKFLLKKKLDYQNFVNDLYSITNKSIFLIPLNLSSSPYQAIAKNKFQSVIFVNCDINEPFFLRK